MRVIDSHVHFIPPAYREEVTRRGLVPFPLPDTPLDGLLAFMDAHAIDAAVLSLTPPGVNFGDQGLAAHLARMVNEATAAAVATAPDRLSGLAVVPLPNAAEELAYALDVLGLDGVVLLSNVLGRHPGEFPELLDELHARGAHVLLHPTAPPYPTRDPVWQYEFPFETTRAIAGLLAAGAARRWPDLRLQAAHLGGTIPFLSARFDDREWLRGLYYDTALSDDPIALAAARAFALPRHVVFGSDWPFVETPGEVFAEGLGRRAGQARRPGFRRSIPSGGVG
jgi:predicted TIM-barrel fold metal-dependent hydrolase